MADVVEGHNMKKLLRENHDLPAEDELSTAKPTKRPKDSSAVLGENVMKSKSE